jgi:endo-1,4-beta-D-glucanase Y
VCAAVAQVGPQSTLVGTVKDSTGAAVPGAKVLVVNTGTQFKYDSVTNAEGSYYIPFVFPALSENLTEWAY